MSTKKLEQFSNQRYLNLESYRKNGTPVATPLWFATENDTIYIYSRANAGKVKRIGNNPKVRIVPCDARGKPKGEWVDANALVLDERGAALGHELLNNKYRWMKRLGDAFSKLMGRQRVVIALDCL